jgi:mRNA-degrading endonuclease RelE of RelBE toxin-antitoxin system
MNKLEPKIQAKDRGWRVVADVIREKEAILILKIGHRKNVYDK